MKQTRENITEKGADHFWEVKDLTVTYKNTDGLTVAAEHVSLYVDQGETIGIVGESGSGKSQTQLASLQLIPTPPGKIESGQVLLEGEDILPYHQKSAFMRSVRGGRVGMIFQEPMTSLNPVKTIGSQITETIVLHRHMNQADADKEAVRLLEEVGIQDAASRLHDYPHQFSGGMRQRIMIAMAMAGNPEMIVADEPTTALDVTTQAQILELLSDVTKSNKAALIIITHNLGIVARYAQRIYVMYAGNVIETGTTMDIFDAPGHPYTKGLLKAVPRLDNTDRRLTPIDGVPPSPANRRKGCQFLDRCRYAGERCRSDEMPPMRELGPGHLAACWLTPEEQSELEKEHEEEIVNKAVPEEDIVLKVRDLCVSFPVRKGLLMRKTGQLDVLQNISFDLHRRETLGLVGESGCGKTTTAKAVLKLLDEARGRVELNGQDILSIPEKKFRPERRKIQMIFQDPYSSLDPRMTAGKIVGESLMPYGLVSSRQEYDRRVDELFRLVGLEPSMRDRVAHEFSGGQRQRIGIARALACQPDILICDEPISALDVSIQAQIINLLEDLQSQLGLSYLFVAHDLSVVKHISHRVAVMYLGTIVETTSSADLYNKPMHPYTQALMKAVPIPDPAAEAQRAQEILTGEVPSIMKRPAGCPFSNRCPYVTDQCKKIAPVPVEVEPGHTVVCHRYA